MTSQYRSFGSLAKLCFAVNLAMSIAGCTVVDAVDQRTTTMNEAIANASNKGILLNLVRASLAEPLSFSTLSNFTGHNSIGGGLAYPTFGATGNQLRIQSTTVTGPTTTGSITNDFTYTGNDDANTYYALLQPVSPAIVGYFLKQDYNRELLYFLLIDRLREFHSAALSRDLPNSPATRYDIEHYGPEGSPFARFGSRLQELIKGGLQVEVDPVTQSARVCFERTLTPYYLPTKHIVDHIFSPSCSDAKILKPKIEKTDKPFSSAVRVRDITSGEDIEISFRSVFGLYRYLGVTIRDQLNITILGDPREDDHRIITVIHGQQDCFIEQDYRGEDYCVPNKAFTTKRVFTLLHDLVKLSTPQAPAPLPTVSARIVGP